jgi:hypothetical protein
MIVRAIANVTPGWRAEARSTAPRPVLLAKNTAAAKKNALQNPRAFFSANLSF